MIVTRTRYLARMKVCEMCKHYKPSTKSCGTIVLGDRVQHNGDEVRLCGCVMTNKAWLAFAKCPLGHWGNQKSTTYYYGIVRSFHNPPTKEEIDTYYRLKSELIGRQIISECDACAIREIREFTKHCEELFEEGNE